MPAKKKYTNKQENDIELTQNNSNKENKKQVQK